MTKYSTRCSRATLYRWLPSGTAFLLLLGSACAPDESAPSPATQSHLNSLGPARIPSIAKPSRPQTPTETLARMTADGFMLGTNWSGSQTAAWSNELGLKWARGTVPFRAVMPEIYDDTLTLEEVDNDPTLLDWFMANADWSWADSHLRGLIEAGVEPVPVIGLGWNGCLPTLNG